MVELLQKALRAELHSQNGNHTAPLHYSANLTTCTRTPCRMPAIYHLLHSKPPPAIALDFLSGIALGR